jgi:hypothetical protein
MVFNIRIPLLISLLITSTSIFAVELSIQQQERILCKPGYQLQQEGCFNPTTNDFYFVLLSINGHSCPSKYTRKSGRYCIPVQK